MRRGDASSARRSTATEGAMRLRVDPVGVVRCLYAEAIDLSTFGSLSIRRASHVEPDDDGTWNADLSPVAGPKLGPFLMRSQALDAERTWLEAHWPAAPTAPFSCPQCTDAC